MGKGDRTAKQLLDEMLVPPGKAAGLTKRPTDTKAGVADKTDGIEVVGDLLMRLDDLHDRLWAEAKRSVLLVLQGMDTAGKDGAIRKVLTGLNPQGCEVASFKAPGAGELAHDYLWRIHEQCPARGRLGVFNRSHYEDVVAAVLVGATTPEQRQAALPPDPRVRADAVRRGHDGRQGVPAHLQGGAARAPPGPDRHAGEALEVQRRTISRHGGTGTTTWPSTRPR